jgi:hypothetical protein
VANGTGVFQCSLLKTVLFLDMPARCYGYFGESCTRRTFSEVRPLVTLTVEQLQLLCTMQVGSVTVVKRSNTRSSIVTKEITKLIKI